MVPYPLFPSPPSAGLVTPSLLTGSQESDSSQSAKKDMLAALKSRQEALEETLRQRLEELKKLCLREAVSGGYCCVPGNSEPSVPSSVCTSLQTAIAGIVKRADEGHETAPDTQIVGTPGPITRPSGTEVAGVS